MLRAYEWLDLAREVDRHRIVTPVTTSEDVYVWAADLSYAMYEGKDGFFAFTQADPPIRGHARDAVIAVDLGLAPGDLWAMAPLLGANIQFPTFESILEAFTSSARSSFANETVRDMVGWLVACSAAGDTTTDEAEERWAQWYEANLEGRHWVYLAAGLSPTETAAGLADGTLGPDQARAMAALRGVALPVG